MIFNPKPFPRASKPTREAVCAVAPMLRSGDFKAKTLKPKSLKARLRSKDAQGLGDRSLRPSCVELSTAFVTNMHLLDFEAFARRENLATSSVDEKMFDRSNEKAMQVRCQKI